MEPDRISQSTVFVLFGATGDLSWRRVVPSLYHLAREQRLPKNFVLLAVGRGEQSVDELGQHFRDGLAKNSPHGGPDDEGWQRFIKNLHYFQADLTEPASFSRLREKLAEFEKQWGEEADHVFYLATPPSLFVPTTCGLGGEGLAEERERARIVVEKPLGHDLESSREVDSVLRRYFEERQIFRIDHFLGKETVQNILALRFANPIFEPIWDRRYVDHVVVTVAETLGVEHRAGYYEHAGALRDMVQNHLMQLFCLVAMEPPISYAADDIRGKKIEVLRAVHPIPPDAISEYAARGQYGDGWIEGNHVRPYREEPGVDPRSTTETYAALKLYVDNWRWQGVPFYLRTGKRMAADISEISIRFRDVPHRTFPSSAGLNAQPARLVIQIQPSQGIVLKFLAKEPGYEMRLRPVNMRFCYADAFRSPSPEAYDTLLWDILIGDATLFMHAEQVEAAWQLLMPVLKAWDEEPPPDFPNYGAGSWGPESGEFLVASDGRSWLTPTLPTECPI